MDVEMSSPPSAEGSTSLALHRLRFLDWSPSPITALAFSPCSSDDSATRSLLAVGRENGNIDLCTWVEEARGGDAAEQQSSGLAKAWVVDTVSVTENNVGGSHQLTRLITPRTQTLVGSTASKIDSLAFMLTPAGTSDAGFALPSQPRLFSTSGGVFLTEHYLPIDLLSHAAFPTSALSATALAAIVDVRTAGTSRSLNSGGGAIWGMTASPTGKYVALGCEDGCVRVVDVAEGRFEHLTSTRAVHRRGNGTLSGVVAKCDRAKTRVVSLTWGPPVRRQAAAKPQSKRKPAAAPDSSDSSDSSDDDDDDDEEDAWEDSFILGGTSSSMALMWDVRTGRVSARLNVDRTRSEHTVVWSCAVLPDSTVVLGDSTGRVTFYDARTHTPLPGASFAAHTRGADVLCLTPGPDGRTVYAAGVDQRVSEYTCVRTETNPAKWVHTATRRLHAHDVRALAIEPALSLAAAARSVKPPARLPILASGGADFSLVLTPAASPSALALRQRGGSRRKGTAAAGDMARDIANPISSNPVTTFADTTQRRLPIVPSTARGGAMGGGAVVCAAHGRRWLALRREKSIGIWALPADDDAHTHNDGEDQERWRKVLEMELKSKTNLVALALSPDGRWLAVSDLYETKLFSLRSHGDGLEVSLEPKRERSLVAALSAAGKKGRAATTAGGSSALAFTPDSSRFVMASFPGSYLHVVELPVQAAGVTGECKLLASFAQHRQRASGRSVAGKQPGGEGVNGHATDDSADVSVAAASARDSFARIDVLAISPDSQYLLSVDTSRRIHTFNLDVLSAHRALPSPAHMPTAAAFDVAAPSKVALLLPTNRVSVYDVESGNASDSSLECAIRAKLEGIRDSAIGASWLAPTASTQGQTTLIVWGATWICTARSDGTAARETRSLTESKRRRQSQAAVSSEPAPWNVKLTHKYQPLLFVDVLPAPSAQQEHALIVVERPFFALARTLKPAFRRPTTYGA